MPDLDFLIHFPLLRIEEELLPFGYGRLYRMPFAKYDEISLGAFSEQQKKFEATEPVFLSFSVAVPEEGLERRLGEVKGMLEIKMPSSRRAMLDELGLHPVNWAHDEVATPAWTALLLAAPASALIPPTWSQTFIKIDGEFTLSLPSGPAVAARVQGEADHEYLFLSDAVSERIPTADIARAARLIDRVREWERVPELHAALITLRATGLPLLSRQDRLTLAVRALESLLLPEVRTTLKKTFARRASALLATDHVSAEKYAKMAADLYSLRSESVHGTKLPDDQAALEGAFAEQMLAIAILSVGALVSAGETLEQIRERLDAGYQKGSPAQDLRIEPTPVGRSSEQRLGYRVPSDVHVPTSRMAAVENRVACWSPLLGLTTVGLEEETGAMLLGRPPAPVLMPLAPEELYALEERDIRRDFLATFWQQGHSMAVLMTVPENDEPVDAFSSTVWLERMRDLGVLALRLAGYDRFHDPELFGSAVFEGFRRLRRPTVIRQTVAEKIRHEAEQRIGPVDGPRLAELWAHIWRYEVGGRSPEIEHVLSLFRRSFDRDFLQAEERAVVLLSLLEAMLGRFRPEGDPVQLEDLLAALAGDNADVRWFREKGSGKNFRDRDKSNGKNFRNAVAHGEFDMTVAGDALEALSRLVSRIVLVFIKTWNAADAGARGRRPSALLIAHAKSLHSEKHR